MFLIFKLIILTKIIYYRLKFFFKKNLFQKKIPKNFKKKLNYNHVNSLQNNGYTVIDNYFSRKECNQIIRNINQFILNSDNKKIWKSNDGSDLRIYRAKKIDKKINIFFKDIKLKNYGENYIDMALKNAFTMCGILKFESENLGSGGGWHKDSINPCYKTMVYLTDVDKIGNGALQIISKSNNIKSVVDHYYYLRKYDLLNTRFNEKEINKLVKYKNYKIKTIKARAGSVILFDGSNLHRGAPIKTKKKRYALTNYYFHNRDIVKVKKDVNKFTRDVKL